MSVISQLPCPTVEGRALRGDRCYPSNGEGQTLSSSTPNEGLQSYPRPPWSAIRNWTRLCWRPCCLVANPTWCSWYFGVFVFYFFIAIIESHTGACAWGEGLNVKKTTKNIFGFKRVETDTTFSPSCQRKGFFLKELITFLVDVRHQRNRNKQPRITIITKISLTGPNFHTAYRFGPSDIIRPHVFFFIFVVSTDDEVKWHDELARCD